MLAADVPETVREAAQRARIGAGAPLGQQPSQMLAEAVVVPVAPSHRDEPQRRIEMPAAVEVEERRQQLAAREIAGRAEDDEAAGGARLGHHRSLPRTACPPKRLRSIASSFEP